MGQGILALDLGLTTGWAFMIGEKPPVASSFSVNALKTTGERSRAHRLWLANKIRTLDPAIVVFESPLSWALGDHARRILLGLAFQVEGVVEDLKRDEGFKIAIYEQDPMSVKK